MCYVKVIVVSTTAPLLVAKYVIEMIKKGMRASSNKSHSVSVVVVVGGIFFTLNLT